MLLNALRIAAAIFGALVLFVLALGCVFSGGMRVAIPTAVAALLAALVAAWVARRTRGPSGPLSGASLLRTSRRGAEATLAVCGAMALTAFAATAFVIRPPAQAKLAAHFQRHRADYEALRDMVRADGLESVQDGGDLYAREAFSYKGPEALGISVERAAAYRRLLGETGGSSIHVWSEGAVAFPVAGWGAANHGWRILLVWSKAAPSPLVPSLDDFRKKGGPRDWERAYSSIAGDWYLAFVW